MITALIFDFDGLLVDTETPAFESWQALYAEYGHELTLDLWQGALGTSHGFDALAHLAALAVQPIDQSALLARRMAAKHVLSAEQPLLPGAREILGQADALGLPCAVASSSSRDWVLGWLHHHGIDAAFACIRTADDVARTKPAPDLFLSAAACLGAPPAAWSSRIPPPASRRPSRRRAGPGQSTAGAGLAARRRLPEGARRGDLLLGRRRAPACRSARGRRPERGLQRKLDSRARARGR